MLVGLQRSIVYLIYQECKKARAKITEPLTLEYLSYHTKKDKKTIKTSVYRLIKKGCILRVEYKNGRSGWTQYELPNEIFHELLQSETDNKLVTNWQQSDNKVVSEVVTEPTTNVPSSSSYINKTTTNLPEEWLCINFEPIADIGFSANHLQQLLDKNSPEVVQESIFHFAYSLNHNSKFKNHENPLNLFMGVLRKGNAWIEPNYRSAQEMALAHILELKAAEQARIKQLQDNAYKISFDEWKSSLSQDEIERIAPKSKSSLAKGGLPERMLLNQFFKETIWPETRKEFNF